MGRCQQPLLLLWLTAAVTLRVGSSAGVVKYEEQQVKNTTNTSLQGSPHSGDTSSVTKLLTGGNFSTLNEAERQELARYPRLEELYLDGHQVTDIPARFFSVVPRLKVLSLSRNNISNLNPESFSGLDVLTEVDLSHNLLTSLDAQLFRGLNNLKVLKLQENPWNCSCPLLSSIREVKAAGVTFGAGRVTCASPEEQAGSDLLEATTVCYSSPGPPFTTKPQRPSTTVHFKQSKVLSTSSKNTLTSNQIINKDQTPVLGNSWKFTACVAALALFTSMLIVCAIKGPSWYKLFYNYRHQRLNQDEDANVVSVVFSETGRHVSHRTFRFEQENRQTEEEDGYFEDPYIKREE